MNICYLFLTCLLINSFPSTNSYCPNDDDLQDHRCTCSLSHGYIQCSSFPRQCRSCHRYHTIYFDEHVNILPIEAFRFYEFFDSQTNKSFTIQFSQINEISSNTFSKIDLDQDRTLTIKISKYLSSTIPTRIFDDLTLQSKSKFHLEIFNITSSTLLIEQYAFDGIKYGYESEFHFSILSAKDTLQFQSNAGSILLPSYSIMELYFANFQRVLFNEHSFDHITEEHSSELRIHFDRFQSALLEHTSFFDLHQLDQSKFFLTFSNFQTFNIEQILFHSITQLQSSLIISIFNISNDICFPSESFSQIKQDINSTFQLEIDYGKNLFFTPRTFFNITQRAQSKFALILTNSNDIYFTNQSLTNFHQEDRSLIDIWIKYGRNLIFDNHAIVNLDIWRSSLLRIGFQYSSGTLQMGPNAFTQINEGQGGELLFQIINSSDFYFRFDSSTNLERLEMIDRIFTDDDLCRISEIPGHLPVKLMKNNPCSCSVYYLYRQLRHSLNPLLLKELTPLCYSDLPLNQIEHQELKCQFEKSISHCQERVEIHIPQGICQKKSNILPHISSSSFSVIISLICFILGLSCIYILSTSKRRMIIWRYIQKIFLYPRRQKLPIFSADSYQQLTYLNEDEEYPSNKTMKIVVKYNSTTDQTQPYLHQNQSDFLVNNEDIILKLNTNPLNDIEEK